MFPSTAIFLLLIVALLRARFGRLASIFVVEKFINVTAKI